MKTIVIAWRDHNDPHHPAKAAVWVHHGTSKDLAKAKAYVARQQAIEASTQGRAWSLAPNRYRVLTFSTSEKEPLARARRAVLGTRTRRSR